MCIPTVEYYYNIVQVAVGVVMLLGELTKNRICFLFSNKHDGRLLYHRNRIIFTTITACAR